MDARDMTFDSETFDVVVSTFAFHHIGNSESRRKAAEEIVRVLKPGGKVFVYDAGFSLNELEETMRHAGLNVQRHGDKFSMVMGEKNSIVDCASEDGRTNFVRPLPKTTIVTNSHCFI